MQVLIGSFAAVTILSILITVYDKNAARRGKWRIPEATLLILAALGGSVGMYITMRLIHHKTRKKKFMVGIPLIFLLQAATAVFLYVRVVPALLG